MKWTTEPPKEAGWYWLVYDCNPKHKQVVLMTRFKGEQLLSCLSVHGEIEMNDLDKMHTRWAGPIPEPEE